MWTFISCYYFNDKVILVYDCCCSKRNFVSYVASYCMTYQKWLNFVVTFNVISTEPIYYSNIWAMYSKKLQLPKVSILYKEIKNLFKMINFGTDCDNIRDTPPQLMLNWDKTTRVWNSSYTLDHEGARRVQWKLLVLLISIHSYNNSTLW